MPEVTAADYLRRIGYTGDTAPTAETLRGIVDAHLAAVPFENLDMLAGRPLDLSRAFLWDKIVVQRRGGVCYELNSALYHLLRALGFAVSYRSARVDTADDELEHCMLRVEIDGAPWLADVGLGSHVVPALPLSAEEQPWECVWGSYRVEPRAGGGMLLCRNPGEAEYRTVYEMYDPERRAEDFLPSYARYGAPGATIFSTHWVVIRATAEARYALVKDHLTLTPHAGDPVVVSAPDEETRRALLRAYFGISPESVPPLA